MRELWYREDPYVAVLSKGKFEPIGMHLVSLPSGEGVVVVEIVEDTAAAESGEFRRCQVLTAVNSIPLRFKDTKDAVETIQYCGDRLEFTVGGYVEEDVLIEILHISEQTNNEAESTTWSYVVRSSIKFPFALPFMLVLFMVSILEGFARMLVNRTLVMFHIEESIPDTKNIFFDLLMIVWYYFVLDMELCYVDPMKRMSKDVVARKNDQDVDTLRPVAQMSYDHSRRASYVNHDESRV
eukprot:m.137933 g.137933  ORF g.137933 m.137933 type:complete len:239 (-) comp12679_c0_seq1:1869-2585(-)